VRTLTGDRDSLDIRTSAVAEEELVAPLDISMRKKLISVLHNAKCNGEESFTKSILVGTGAQIGLMDTWAAYWSFGSATASYYPLTSSAAKEQMAANNVDFGMLNEGLGDAVSSKRLDDDVVLMPAAAQPIVPGTRPNLDPRVSPDHIPHRHHVMLCCSVQSPAAKWFSARAQRGSHRGYLSGVRTPADIALCLSVIPWLLTSLQSPLLTVRSPLGTTNASKPSTLRWPTSCHRNPSLLSSTALHPACRQLSRIGSTLLWPDGTLRCVLPRLL
jgi:hypothetical protein